MKNLTAQFVKYLDNDEFKRRLDNYARALKEEHWTFVRDVFLSVKGEMLTDMLSYRFTTLNEHEKDATQKAYYQIGEILDFLADPKNWVRRKTLKQKLYDLNGKVVKPNQKKGEQQNGRRS